MNSSSTAVDLDEEVDDDRRRMQELTSDEMQRIYGRGFRLLQKAGFSSTDSATAPIRVVVRKPREGLKDDDLANRQTLGESKTKGAASTKPMTVEDIQGSLTQLKRLLPNIAAFIESRGGSCSLSEIINKEIKVHIPSMNQRFFLIAARLVGTADYGFRITEDDGNVILGRPTGALTKIKCACGASWTSKTEWVDHTFSDFEISHQDYHTVLSRRAQEVACLACLREFGDLVKVVKHCRLLKSETKHRKFGKVVLQTFLGDDSDIKNLLLVAMEAGDQEFPWTAIAGGAQDPLEDIPFMKKLIDEGPPTPIHLDEDSSDDDPIEVIDINQDFINLED